MRNLKSIAGAVLFMVLWAGAALAMPTSLFSTDDEPSAVADLVADSELEAIEVEATPEGETVDVTVPKDKGDEDDSDDNEARPDNHGKAVSTAAHCDLKGRAKGQLVSSVARDKSATVESAQAACDAAIAAAAAGASSKPVKATKPTKAVRAPKPDQVSKPAAKPAPKPKLQQPVETEEVTEAQPTEAPATESGPPAHAGPPADKGSKKP